MSKTALHNPDGSLTIYIQHDRPSDDHVANWLPAPAGSFNVTMRCYTPLSSVLDEIYRLPPSGAQSSTPRPEGRLVAAVSDLCLLRDQLLGGIG